MSLFSEIAGLKGENLSSAVLAHLLLRSPDARDTFVRKISDISPTGPIYRKNHFAVFLEQHSEWKQDEDNVSRRGRLDLVIETDNFVIGIENKFYAPFQDDQPKCYLQHLQDTCEKLEELRGNEFNPVLIVLAPESRRLEVKDHLISQEIRNRANFLSWKELIKEFSQLEDASILDRFLIRELAFYVQDQVGQNLDMPRLLPHLRKRWEDRGTSAQHQFLNGFIWSLLGDSVKSNAQYYRSGVGKEYYGWYLYPNPGDQETQIWIGFMTDDYKETRAGLFVAVKPADEFEKNCSAMDRYKPERLQRSGWHEHGWTCFRIPFREDTEWHEPHAWSEALKPLNDLLEKESQNRSTDNGT